LPNTKGTTLVVDAEDAQHVRATSALSAVA